MTQPLPEWDTATHGPAPHPDVAHNYTVVDSSASDPVGVIAARSEAAAKQAAARQAAADAALYAEAARQHAAEQAAQ